MNFEKMIDTIIAEKIKKARKDLKMTQEEFCDTFQTEISIDKFRLSNLENAKRHKKKNPHFLTEDSIEFFSSLLDISSKEFLFGEENERLILVKLIILNIFMNADNQKANAYDINMEQNPIFDLDMNSSEEFFRLAKYNLDSDNHEDELDIANADFDNFAQKHKTSLQSDRKKISIFLENKDSFFYSARISKYYTALMDGQKFFSVQSSIILKCLLGNFDFASRFLDARDSSENLLGFGLTLRDPSTNQFYIDNYLKGEGSFSASAINWKESYFKLFIAAYNEFIHYHSKELSDFFEDNVFNKSLKHLTNDYINKLFSGDEFIALLNDIYLKDQFILERMVGHNYARAIIQKFSLIRDNSERLKKENMSFPSDKEAERFYDISSIEKSGDKYTLEKYLYDYENMTVLFANSGQKYQECGLYLPSYFNIYKLR